MTGAEVGYIDFAPCFAYSNGLEFSDAYAEQNERDYQQLVEAVNSGRIVAQTGL